MAAIPPRDPRWKFAGDDPVARQIREKLSDMSRDLGRFGEHAAKREGETTADPQLGKAWEKAVASLRAAEAAVDRARHDLYPLG